MQWYFGVWKNYAEFDGRASRTEYWMFTLFNVIALSVLLMLSVLLRINSTLMFVYELAIIVPSFAVQFRRLHDTGQSGWWMLISLVPLAGAIVLLVFYLLPSEPGMNRYGPEPVISRSSSASLF